MRKWLIKRAMPTALAVAVLTLVVAPAAMATTVTPDYVTGNPTCASLGLISLVKFDDDPAQGEHADDGVTITVDGSSVDWESDTPIDAVIMKGGDNANVYHYDEATSDTGLNTPVNDNNETNFGLSHVDFCYDTDLDSVDVDVSLGDCVDDGEGASHTPVTVTIDGDGSATVVVKDGDDNVVATFTSSGSEDLEPGDYTYTVTADEGSELADGSDDGGTLHVADCSTSVLAEGSVSVEVGNCDNDQTPVDVNIAPSGAATVTVTDPDGNTQTFDGDGGSFDADPGHYTWSAVASDGYDLTGDTSGSFTAAECTEGSSVKDDDGTRVLGTRLAKTGDPVKPIFIAGALLLMMGEIARRLGRRDRAEGRAR